jgi:hypothetical protein
MVAKSVFQSKETAIKHFAVKIKVPTPAAYDLGKLTKLPSLVTCKMKIIIESLSHHGD